MPAQEIHKEVYSFNQIELENTIYSNQNEALMTSRVLNATSIEEKSIEPHIEPLPLNRETESWQIALLLIAVVLLGIVKAFSNNRYNLGIRALINFSVAREINREEQVFFHRSNLLLTISYILSLSLFLYQINKFWLDESSKLDVQNNFLTILGALIILYLGKYFFSILFMFIFDVIGVASEYAFNVSLFNNFLGVMYLPVLCLSFFTSFPFQELLFFVAIPIAFVVFSMRLYRLFQIGKTLGLLYVYIFLYICTLEILPLVVLYRIFIR